MFEHFYIHRKKKLRVNLVSAFDLPLVQAGMHGLYTGHITHGTRFGMKYYAKNVVPVFCVSCASVFCHFNVAAVHNSMGWENKESGSGLRSSGWDNFLKGNFFKVNSYYIQNSGKK